MLFWKGTDIPDREGTGMSAGMNERAVIRVDKLKTYDKIPSLTVGGRKNGYTLDFIRAVAIFCFVTICAIFLLIPVLTVSFL